MASMKKGYTCSGCSQYHTFPVYVAAHWYEELVHTCTCGQRNAILKGETWCVQKARRKKGATGSGS
jgi:hypothetical protein